MISAGRKAAFMAGIVSVATAVLGAGSTAYAHPRGGSVVIETPVAVVGFSYGNPHWSGSHVHASPVHCSVGPIVYYPDYGVYGHYHPRYRFYRYRQPVIAHHGYTNHYRSGHGHHGYTNHYRSNGHHGYTSHYRSNGHHGYTKHYRSGHSNRARYERGDQRHRRTHHARHRRHAIRGH